MALEHRHGGHVADLRANHEHRARRAAQVHRVDDHQPVHGVEQLLDQMDASDAELENAHRVRHRSGLKAAGHHHPEPVVPSQEVPNPGNEYPHRPRIGRIFIPGEVGVNVAGDLEGAVAELLARLRRYPPERYPVQHATVQFHLGLTFSRAGRLAEAQAALSTSARLFDPGVLPMEHAKAVNARGAVRRQLGHLGDAAADFRRAAEIFESSDADLERAAALFNLGLVRRELGDVTGAISPLRQAQTIFRGRHLPLQTAASGRELGTSLLSAGEPDAAVGPLEEAAALAERAGDEAGFGAACNTLGLAHLDAGRVPDAVESFRAAAGAHPRSVRPEEHAMAKANLALAYEQAKEAARARLAALQALGTTGAPGPVRVQASGVLARLGRGQGNLMSVLDEEPPDRWAVIVREEVARWADADEVSKRAESDAWIEGQLARPATGIDLAAAWLEALLELPPASIDGLIRAALEAFGDRPPDDQDRFRDEVESAMARFHTPQLLRLRDIFDRLAAELGQEPSW